MGNRDITVWFLFSRTLQKVRIIPGDESGIIPGKTLKVIALGALNALRNAVGSLARRA